MQPKSIKKIPSGEIEILWSNGHGSYFSFKQLREICPCAGCRGEDNLLFQHPPISQRDHPEKFNVMSMQQIGSYAVQIEWGDGHNAGIYTWDYLYGNCSCNECSELKKKLS